MDAERTDAALGSAQARLRDSHVGDNNLIDTARGAWDDLRAALHERGRLLTLEARLAGLTFVQLVMYAVMVAVLVVTAWLGLVACAVLGLISVGLHWALGLILGVVFNLVIAALMVRAMIGLLDRLDLQATLRRLKGEVGP
jgi:hypothetical protein